MLLSRRIDTDSFQCHEEEPTFELDTPEKKRVGFVLKNEHMPFTLSWLMQAITCISRTKLIRGPYLQPRLPSKYPQGTAFKKAMLELVNEELVTGVP